MQEEAGWETFTLTSAALLTAQPSAFTYHGRLAVDGAFTNGLYDLQFTLHDAPTGGNLIAGPLTNAATAVSSGLFTVPLDFGAAAFNGNARWLGIGLRTNGSGSFAILTTRQPFTAVPYAIRRAFGLGLDLQIHRSAPPCRGGAFHAPVTLWRTFSPWIVSSPRGKERGRRGPTIAPFMTIVQLAPSFL